MTDDKEVWVGIHHHKHGLDLFVFDWEPDEDEIISRIADSGSTFEKNEDYEYIEIRGPVPVYSSEE